MNLERYLAHRRRWETVIVLAVFLIVFVASLGEAWLEHRSRGSLNPFLEPLLLEVTSFLALLGLYPLLLAFDRRYPLAKQHIMRSVAAHFVGSLVFSVLHVVLMYWMRVVAFRLADWPTAYHWTDWTAQLLYEYTKDLRTYLAILALTYLYRFILRRTQGEAGFVDEATDEQESAASDRFLVKKLGREFLVRIDEIDWIESCGNYVNLHVGSKVYPLRDTMTNISARLAERGFLRVHRTAIVNLDRVSEIVPFDTGDGQIRLSDETVVPVSRRFRQELRAQLH